jgi:hypothetical protein
MFGQQPFGAICDNASANFIFPFQPNLRPFLSFQTILGGQGGASGLKAWSVSSSEPKSKNRLRKCHYFVIKKILTLKPHT